MESEIKLWQSNWCMSLRSAASRRLLSSLGSLSSCFLSWLVSRWPHPHARSGTSAPGPWHSMRHAKFSFVSVLPSKSDVHVPVFPPSLLPFLESFFSPFLLPFNIPATFLKSFEWGSQWGRSLGTAPEQRLWATVLYYRQIQSPSLLSLSLSPGSAV